MARLTTDVRQAWRALLQRKTYFLTGAGTVALVLGANAALFAVVSATMLRPMPFVTAGEVLHLFSQPPGTSGAGQRNPLQQMEVPYLRERLRTLTSLEGYYPLERVILRGTEPTVAPTAAVTPGLLTMMGAPIAQGRAFLPAEADPGHLVAVISHRYWQDLGGGPVLGTPLVIDGQPHVIVGVLSSSFVVPFLEAAILTPLVASAEPQPRSPPRSVVAVAALAPGASMAQAREELAGLSRQLAAAYPRTHTGWVLGAETAREWQYGAMKAPLLMLLAAAAVVLLIACVNLASLTSAQALSRSGELALRVALGASRADVLRVYVTELLIVAVSGLVPGLLLAWAAVPALLAIDLTIARTLGAVVIDWRVQVFSVVAALVTAFAAAVVPARRAMTGQLSTELTAGTTRSTAGRRAARVQRAMVAAEVALCLALVMAGAVVVQGLRALAARSPGYDAAGVLTAQIRLPDAAYATPALRASTVQRMLDTVRQLPGVVSAGITQNAFVPGFTYQTQIAIKDRPLPDGQLSTVEFRRVSPDYFATMQIRTLHGRAFVDADVAERPLVTVVSRRFAETLLPGTDPLGQTVLRGAPTATALTIVGVVDDVFDVSLTQAPEATLYLPWAQNNNSAVPVAFVIRASVDPTSLLPALRGAIGGIDASLPLRKAQPLEVFLRESTAPERFRSMVLGLLAALGLVLAAVGIGGVTHRAVVARSKEFAVRLALGSAHGGLVGLVVRESLRDLAVGGLVGLAGGAALCGVLAHALDHVAPVDTLTTAVAVALIVATGVLAALAPALRLLRAQPAEALRG